MKSRHKIKRSGPVVREYSFLLALQKALKKLLKSHGEFKIYLKNAKDIISWRDFKSYEAKNRRRLDKPVRQADFSRVPLKAPER